MAQADIDSRLSGVLRLPGDSCEKFRAGCDRFTMSFPVHKPGVEAPPIVNLSNESGRDLTAIHVLRCKPSPTPLVFEFVKRIFRISAFPIKRNQRGNLIRQTAHKNDVFVGDDFQRQLPILRQERQCLFVILGYLLFDEPPAYNHLALATPSAQTHFSFDAFKPLTAVHPAAFLLDSLP